MKETKYVKMAITDGICYFTYKQLDKVDVEDAKLIVEDRLDYASGATYPYLFDIREVKNFDKGARDYMADKGNDLVSASAILVDSFVMKTIANFFITVNRPKKPTRLFTDYRKALEWLDEYKSQ